jgi:hypothetical protein
MSTGSFPIDWSGEALSRYDYGGESYNFFQSQPAAVKLVGVSLLAAVSWVVQHYFQDRLVVSAYSWISSKLQRKG